MRDANKQNMIDVLFSEF